MPVSFQFKYFTYVLITWFLLICLSNAWCLSPVEETYALGKATLQDKKYSQSADYFLKALQQGANGADLFYNLGNAWAKMGEPGKALAAWEAGLRCSPRDRGMQANKALVLQQSVGSQPEIPRTPVIGMLETLYSVFTLNEFSFFLLLCIFITTAVTIQALTGYHRIRWYQVFASLGLLLTIIAGLLVYGKYQVDYVRFPAYVVVPKAIIRSGPGEHFEQIVTLVEGTKVIPLATSGMWLQVDPGPVTASEDAPGNGWIKRDDVLRFMPDGQMGG